MHTDRRGGWRRGCAIAAIIGCAVLALAILGGYLYDRAWERRVEAKLQEYRDAGQPVTWQEVLATRPQIPDDENAALVLLQAFDLLEELETPADEFLQSVIPSEGRLGWRNSDAMLDLARSRREALAEPLRLIHEAAQLEAGVYPLDPDVPPLLLQSGHLSALRRAARLCAVQSVCTADEGASAEAAAALLQATALPASLGRCVTLLEILVRVAVDDILVHGLEGTLGLCELASTDLATVRQRIAREDAHLSIEAAFIGERAMRRDSVSRFYPADLVGGGAEAEARMWRLYSIVPGLKERDALYHYETMTEAARIATLPMPARLGKASDLSEETDRTFEDGRWKYLLSYMLMPAFSRALTEEMRGHARLRAAVAALAVEEWRMAHGTWPDSLEALVPDMLPAIPEDPFTGEPLRYRRRDGGVVVYSIGPDEKDDGGVAYDEAQEKAGEHVEEGWDVAFRLLDPDLRGAQTMTFRDEVMGSSLSLEELEEAGFPRERLLELGLTEEDLMELQS